MEKCKAHLNSWSQRDLSIIGRTLLTKTETISRFIYPAQSLSVHKDAIKAINQANFNYIWKGKTHYIKKSKMIRNYEEGGVRAIDFECIDGTIKTNWLKQFLNKKTQIWFHIPNNIFMKLGGIKFLLSCDYDLKTLPYKISSFHYQTLFYWKMIYKHNFSPHNIPIWNCRYILHNRKSLFIQNRLDKGIWSVSHLLDCNGNLLSFEDFCAKFNIIDKQQYKKVFNAIPKQVL